MVQSIKAGYYQMAICGDCFGKLDEFPNNVVINLKLTLLASSAKGYFQTPVKTSCTERGLIFYLQAVGVNSSLTHTHTHTPDCMERFLSSVQLKTAISRTVLWNDFLILYSGLQDFMRLSPNNLDLTFSLMQAFAGFPFVSPAPGVQCTRAEY